MSLGTRIDYKTLRKINPEAARQAVLEYLQSNGGNVSDAARLFAINRAVVYDILRKQVAGDLRDRSKVPKRQPKRTPAAVEQQVVETKRQTRLGPQRLSIYLRKYEGIEVPAGTIRHILRRNAAQLGGAGPGVRHKREKREFVDWYSAKPFEVVQMSNTSVTRKR